VELYASCARRVFILAKNMVRLEIKMAKIVKVDRWGRLVLPQDVRRAVGIKGAEELLCRVVGDKIILEKFSPESISTVLDELEEIAPSLELDAEETEEGDKYIDEEYALRKLGIRGTN